MAPIECGELTSFKLCQAAWIVAHVGTSPRLVQVSEGSDSLDL